MKHFPTRIHVLLASHAPLGLVIRRGPSKRVATILWNRSNDEFQTGQWFKGRIYERRSDLSADGRHFIYFASNGQWDSQAKGSWTAISRAPYLKAMAIFPKGDCWRGGGLWTDNTTYWLNDVEGHSILRNTKQVRRNKSFTPANCYGNECPGVYYHRLLRDGWQLADRGPVTEQHSQETFEKQLTHGWTLRKIAHAESDRSDGIGCYWDEHLLVHEKSKEKIACQNWEWADLDKQRVVWASGGKLYAGHMVSGGVANETELFDFNPMTFEAIKAPY